MKYSVGYNTENKPGPTYTLDNWIDFEKIKVAREFIKTLRERGIVGNQYVILKKTSKGATQVY